MSRDTEPEHGHRVRAGLTGPALVSHLFMTHGIWCKSVHDTEDSNQECHKVDHEEHFSHGCVPHEHTLPAEPLDEWSW